MKLDLTRECCGYRTCTWMPLTLSRSRMLAAVSIVCVCVHSLFDALPMMMVGLRSRRGRVPFRSTSASGGATSRWHNVNCNSTSRPTQ